MTLINLKCSDPNRPLRDLMSGILDVKGICGAEKDLHPTVANVRHAAVTLLEIADGWSKAADDDALRSVLFDVVVITNEIDIFPDGGEFADHLSTDCPNGHGFYPSITPANLRTAAHLLLRVADDHDDAVA
jgi:hypothetical protein